MRRSSLSASTRPRRNYRRSGHRCWAGGLSAQRRGSILCRGDRSHGASGERWRYRKAAAYVVQSRRKSGRDSRPARLAGPQCTVDRTGRTPHRRSGTARSTATTISTSIPMPCARRRSRWRRAVSRRRSGRLMVAGSPSDQPRKACSIGTRGRVSEAALSSSSNRRTQERQRLVASGPPAL